MHSFLNMQLYERRTSQAKGWELQILRQLNKKSMSDEETDDEPNTFIKSKRSPSWRSDKLSALFHTLDQRYESKHGQSTKNRKVGAVKDRSQP